MKKNLPLYLSIAAVLLLCALLLGYVFYMNFSNGESDNNEAGSQTSNINSSEITRDEAVQTLERFVNALKSYDITGMTHCLSVFPDKSRDGTNDDMYNDLEYQQLYRAVFPSITYEVKSYSDNCATISVTMPNIKSLYQESAMKLQMGAMYNEELKEKLMENDTNAIVLYKQLMLNEAIENNNVQQMTKEYTLTFDRAGEAIQIIADDQLCAFMTGDFSTTRNLPSDVVE